MIDLYKLHKNPKKLDFYKKYGRLLDIVIDEIGLRPGINFKRILHIIERSPEYAYLYARDIIKGRFIESEKYIMKSPIYGINYADRILCGRWPEIENDIIQNPKYAFYYAFNVIHGRWIDAEKYIKKDPQWAYNYARLVIKNRWQEAESYIKKDKDCWKDYCREFKLKPPRIERPYIILDDWL